MPKAAASRYTLHMSGLGGWWPYNYKFGFHGPEVYDIYAPMDDVGTAGVPDTYGRVREGDVVQRHERTEPGEKGPMHPEEGGVVCSLFPVP